MLLTNGRIYTLDRAGSIVDTLLVRDGWIVFAGRRSEVSVPASEPTIDLRGRAVLPGLVDAHAHLQGLARMRLSLDLRGLPTEEAAARLVAEAARRAAPGEWLVGRGWDQNLWPGQRFPDRGSLDRAAPRHPVALVRTDSHAIWVNSLALQLAGISRATADPPGGRIVRDDGGEPTGLLIDRAQRLIEAIIPEPTEEQFDRAVGEAIGECLARGLTGIHEMGVGLEGLGCYRRLVERGQFPFRNYAAVAARSPEAWGYYRERGPEVIGDGQVVVRAVKFLADGALGSRGAALHELYCDDPGNTGLVLVPAEDLERGAREAAERGFQVCVHAIGDRANTLALDVFERLLVRNPSLRALRLRVEHAQVLAEADLPRFARLGVLPSMQPAHCISDMPWAAARLGPDRVRRAYAWRSLLSSGVPIAGGSDFPVEDPNPFHGIHAAVTRRPLAGEDPGWQPEQRMTRSEAVRAFTAWNAWASHQEEEVGTLEPRRRADLVVLSEDVFACSDAEIKGVRPVLTMVGGQVAFGHPEGL